MRLAELAPLARMAAQLPPGQAAHRVRLSAQRTVLRRWPGPGRLLCGGPDPVAATGWPAAFSPLDARLAPHWPARAELGAGKIRLLGTARALGDPADWRQADAPLLWRFHLHYWDWAWALAADPDRLAARAVFARLWRSWRVAAGFGRGEAWHPYPAALRAWSWCGLHRDLVAGSEIEPCFVAELALHAGFLRRHLEYDVGGNHLVKDLKALTGLGVFFADGKLLRLAAGRLREQLAVQVLPDGGHYERAPAYHCQVLADLIDVADLVAAAGGAPPSEITAAITSMRRWLGAVLSPGGEVPMLNDGYPVPGELLAGLRPKPRSAAAVLALPDTGLVRASLGGWDLLADVGGPGQAGPRGHAHAGTFGCLLHVNGEPLLVDTGTSTYEPGPVRGYERSTAAHNTVEVDGADSAELWGAFRAGRRARIHGPVIHGDAAAVSVAAVHDGYRGLRGRPRHRRRWSLTSTGLEVDDLVTGRGRHVVVIRWHLAPGSVARLAPGGAAVTTAAGRFLVTVAAASRVRLAVGAAPVAAGFLRTTGSPVVTCRIDAGLPVRVTTRWRQLRGPDGAAGVADVAGLASAEI